MNLRVVAAVALALLVGVGGGYAVAAGESSGDETAAPAPQSATITPLPATPGVPVRLITPDVEHPALATNLSLGPVELPRPVDTDIPGTTRQRSSLPVPVGWIQAEGPGKYTFTDPDAPENTYALTVEFLDDFDVPTALRRRTNALSSAEIQGNMADLEIDVTLIRDGFDAHLIDSGGYRRGQLERFYPGPGGRIVTVRAVGRDRDEPGLTNLVSLISRDYRVVG